MSALATLSEPWWGDFEVSPGATGRWRIGPMRLWLQHRTHEWRLSWHGSPDPLDSTVGVEVPWPGAEPVVEEAGETLVVARYAAPGASSKVSLLPRLADRSTVIRPEDPFHIPAGVSATFFANTALWVEVRIGDPARAICELPIARPPDTWFGPDKTVGELCYASRTWMRMRYEDLPHRPHRAATQITVVNRAAEPLAIERMLLPVDALSLYRHEDGYLTTEPVTLTRSDKAETTFVVSRVGPGPRARRVSPPRRSTTPAGVVRALGAIFSHPDRRQEPGTRA